MKLRIAINGFGRIGKNFLRAIMADPLAKSHLDVIVINSPMATADSVAFHTKYDTILGQYTGNIQTHGDRVTIEGHSITITQAHDSSQINWEKYGVQWVVDCSGAFTHRGTAQKHIDAGAKKVLISAPAYDEDITIIPGFNMHAYSHDHTIVSLGSCTTNALVPLLYVLQEHIAVQAGTMLTVHAYTNSQALLDTESHDLRKSRAASLNIIPTSTGAARVINKLFPELAGKLVLQAVRVPVGIVSFLTLTLFGKHKLTVHELHTLLEYKSQAEQINILKVNYSPLVSSDFMQTPYSTIVDALSTEITDSMVSVSAWYDNEWAYSLRLKDFLLYVHAK